MTLGRIQTPAAPEPGPKAFYQRTATALAQLRDAVPRRGVAIVNLGAFPGASDAQLVVTGQPEIRNDSVVQAWITPVATADHSADEHLVEPLVARAGQIVPGVGFTLFVLYTGAGDALAYGQWSVAWSWT